LSSQDNSRSFCCVLLGLQLSVQPDVPADRFDLSLPRLASVLGDCDGVIAFRQIYRGGRVADKASIDRNVSAVWSGNNRHSGCVEQGGPGDQRTPSKLREFAPRRTKRVFKNRTHQPHSKILCTFWLYQHF